MLSHLTCLPSSRGSSVQISGFGRWKVIYEHKMVIDVNLYLKNENEDIHCPVSLRTPELTVKKETYSGCAVETR